jgi:hypothetical protein
MAKKSNPAKQTSIYSVHPGVAMIEKWVKELPEKTGRSLEAWIKHTRREGPPEEKDRRAWLKEKHGFGSNAAWWIADYASRPDGAAAADYDPDAYLAAAEKYVEAMFAGPKAGLVPTYQKLMEMALALGDDIRICPCQTIVPVYRHHVIAQAKPSTRTRLDFGFALGDTKATGRLIDTGGFAKKDRITHRIPLSSVDDIDDEVGHWLEAAYQRDAE